MRYADVDASPAYQLWLATNAWQRAIRKTLDQFDLTHVQFVILASIDLHTQNGDLPTQIEVCRFGAMDENMVSQVVRTLTKKGLVRRDPHPTDRRAQVLALTDEGKELIGEVRPVVKETSKTFFAPLGERATEFTDLLRLLSQGHNPCPARRSAD